MRRIQKTGVRMNSRSFANVPDDSATNGAANGRKVVEKKVKLRNKAKRLLWLSKIHVWVRKTKPPKPR